MTIGNRPKNNEMPVVGTRYWWLSIGRHALPSTYLDGGWRGFEFTILKPYKKQYEGASQATLFKVSFAFWLPFYSL